MRTVSLRAQRSRRTRPSQRGPLEGGVVEPSPYRGRTGAEGGRGPRDVDERNGGTYDPAP